MSKIRLPSKLSCLNGPERYKILYGGRGGAKSWGVARTLLIKGAEKKLRILCCREIQKSIKTSVHQLLADQIHFLKLTDFYEIQANTIKGRNGTEIGFEGLKHNITGIKSWEGADIAWVEEAQTVSKNSWDILIPTIRAKESQIWLTFNPELETDETYQRFVINPPKNSKVVEIGWQDNPWFPDVLAEERDELKERDFDAYLHVWEGKCRQCLEGAVYVKELQQATAEKRICNVPYDASKPVHTFWDLGWSDSTSVILAQKIGFEYRIIDFIQDNQNSIQHYLNILQNKGYVYGNDYMPHDALQKQLAAHGRSIQEQMQSMGRKVQIVPKHSLADGINAARTIFNQCYFDQTRCADLIQNLRHYRYDVDELGQFSKKPLHDHNSHAADAFRYMALSINETGKKKKPKTRAAKAHGWMG